MMNNKTKKSNLRIFSFVLCAILVISMCVGLLVITGSAATADKQEAINLIPGGIPFGVKFNTEGVVVIGFSDIDQVQKSQNPAYSAGLRIKDVITKIDGEAISSADQLTKTIEASGGKEISLTYRRAGQENTVTLIPLFSKSENKYKTGVWVRDSGAGIGTVTFIDPESLRFGGLGHGICDGETGELIPMRQGVVMDVNISSIKKGIAGVPGEIKGYFGAEKKGFLSQNTDCGVYGVLKELPKNMGSAIAVATKEETQDGEAKILCTLENGQREEYKIEISSVNKDADGSKCFVIHITDNKLIEKTGGIVQGMSGSPIIQNGKLVGAVTHVLINDPTTGYGIFIENMLNSANIPMAKAS